MTGTLRHRLQTLFPAFLEATLHSYSVVFFSTNRLFALILMGVSFFDPNAGLSGLVAVILSNSLAYLIGFNRASIRSGFYGFNSLLTGIGLGVYYQPSPEFFALLLFVSLLTLFLTVSVEGFLGKYGLPFLSIPFLLAIWIASLAARQFHSLPISEHGVYMMNEMYRIGNLPLVEAYNWFFTLQLPLWLQLYFRSLGAIIFQYYLLAGMLVALGLLIYSRIAFVLSLAGFFAAYLYYVFIGADLHELSAGYIGFNFILTSIAVGGFFLVPSGSSFLWTLLLTPVVAVMLTAFDTLFAQLQLSVFSLPFNIAVILFLYVMKLRERFLTKPELISYQQFSPEKNLYALESHYQRFGRKDQPALALPFRGTWQVTQGHADEPTHQGDWQHAWDFELTDENGNTFLGEGTRLTDYHAYGKPVTAPADGVVEEVTDEVEDNAPGQVNTRENWGNAIVLRHAPQLYSKLTHLKKGSLRVHSGDTVKQGDVLGLCGNSGRSPYPHLHLQVQSTPYIGSRTLRYPLAQYILREGRTFFLRSQEIPQKGALVSNIEPNEALDKAFRFIPGQKLKLVYQLQKEETRLLEWEVLTDSLNFTYLYCPASRSKAWFRFQGHILWFTHFEGRKDSVLFRFFLGAFKIVTGFYPGMEISDRYPLSLVSHKALMVLQDFVAPFTCLIRAEYRMTCKSIRHDLVDPEVVLVSTSDLRGRGKASGLTRYQFRITGHGLDTFTWAEKEKTFSVRFVHDETD